jgi:hypothetical protein
MFENSSMLMSKIISDNIKTEMEDSFSLNKLEENYKPAKKSSTSFKLLLVFIVGAAFVGFCFTGPSNPNKTANNYNIVSDYNM